MKTNRPYVHFDGPVPDRDREGEEIPAWSVCLCADSGDPIGKVYWCKNYYGARTLAENMARDRRVELLDEAGKEI